MELPGAVRKRMEDFSRSMFDPSRTQPSITEKESFLPHDQQILSSLPLQMSLYFNLWFFPCWWISETVMLHLKYPVLPDYYKFILVTVLIAMTLIEAIRLFLGYTGNLQQKVPELAIFWLLSILLQFPLILFQLFNEGILIQPLERGVHIVLAMFILTQSLSGFVALRNLVRHTRGKFINSLNPEALTSLPHRNTNLRQQKSHFL